MDHLRIFVFGASLIIAITAYLSFVKLYPALQKSERTLTSVNVEISQYKDAIQASIEEIEKISDQVSEAVKVPTAIEISSITLQSPPQIRRLPNDIFSNRTNERIEQRNRQIEEQWTRAQGEINSRISNANAEFAGRVEMIQAENATVVSGIESRLTALNVNFRNLSGKLSELAQQISGGVGSSIQSAFAVWLPLLGTLSTAALGIYFSWNSDRRAERANERADEADLRAKEKYQLELEKMVLEIADLKAGAS